MEKEIPVKITNSQTGESFKTTIKPSELAEQAKKYSDLGFVISEYKGEEPSSIPDLGLGFLAGVSLEAQDELRGETKEEQKFYELERKASEERSPWAFGTGKLVGSLIPSAIATQLGAKAAPAVLGSIATSGGPVGTAGGAITGTLLGGALGSAGATLVENIMEKPVGEKSLEAGDLGSAAVSALLGGPAGKAAGKVGKLVGEKAKKVMLDLEERIPWLLKKREQLFAQRTRIQMLKNKRAVEAGIPRPQYRKDVHDKFLSEDETWQKLTKAQAEIEKQIKDTKPAEALDALLGRKANVQTQLKQLDDQIEQVSKIRPKEARIKLKEIDDAIAKIKAQPKRPEYELRKIDDLAAQNKRIAQQKKVLKDLEKQKEDLLKDIDEATKYPQLAKMSKDRKELLQKLEKLEKDILDNPFVKLTGSPLWTTAGTSLVGAATQTLSSEQQETYREMLINKALQDLQEKK